MKQIFAASRLVTLLACLLPLALPVSAANYVITELGDLGGTNSSATDINNAAQVVGVSSTSDGSERAFLWENGIMKDLGTLGGDTSHAAAINASGTVVGWAKDEKGVTRACLFSEEGNVSLGNAGAGESWATDINDLGQVVGWWASTKYGYLQEKPMVWKPLMRELDVEGTWNRAMALNNSGTAVGWTSSTFSFWGPQYSATVWLNVTQSTSSTLLNGHLGHAFAINDAGHAVGHIATAYAAKRAARWITEDPEQLGSLGLSWSTAASINGQGQIVGTAAQRAFLWENGVMADLNYLIPPDSGWELMSASSINDAGQIVGAGKFNGQTQGYLLTPVDAPNKLPSVRITKPAHGAWLQNSSVTIEVQAVDPDGTIRNVELLTQRVVKPTQPGSHVVNLGGPRSSPLEHVTGSFFGREQEFEAGNYLIMATATDNAGAVVASAEVELHIDPPPVLQLIPLRPLAPPPGIPSPKTYSLLVRANEEASLRLEASHDLILWTPITLSWIVPLSLPTTSRYASVPADAPHTFYRVVRETGN